MREAILRWAEPYRPPLQHLQTVTAVAERIRPDRSQLQDWYRTYATHHAARVAHDLALLKRFASFDDLIIDIGAAPYLLTAALHEEGYKIEGVDISLDRFAGSIAELGLKILECNIEADKLPYKSHYANIVILNEVFEHLRLNPNATFAELYRILKPGGLLIMSTPNGLSLQRLAGLLLRGRPGPRIYDEFDKLDRIGHMGHVREYAVNEVLDFLRRASFQPIAIVHRGRYAATTRTVTLIAADVIVRAIGRLRPFFTVVARKAVDPRHEG